jgi:hypothetical protein
MGKEWAAVVVVMGGVLFLVQCSRFLFSLAFWVVSTLEVFCLFVFQWFLVPPTWVVGNWILEKGNYLVFGFVCSFAMWNQFL